MGILYIVSTPIGNLEDITIRAIKTLFSVQYILCEDTRKTGILLQELNNKYSTLLHSSILFKAKLIRFDDKTENRLVPECIGNLLDNHNLAIVSDAGTPLINDPGYLLVRECRKRNIPVVSIPGPTALISALTISGLPTDKFMFLGYPPEKSTHRLKLFQSLVRHPERIRRPAEKSRDLLNITYIFYCAPHKLQQTLKDMRDVIGDIEITIVRELTKIHEEVRCEKITEMLNLYKTPKGEFVIVLLF